MAIRDTHRRYLLTPTLDLAWLESNPSRSVALRPGPVAMSHDYVHEQKTCHPARGFVEHDHDNVVHIHERSAMEGKIEAAIRQPKTRGRGGMARQQTSLKDFGVNPATSKTVSLLSGRYGAYVSDGEINATVTRGTDPMQLTPEQAFELLAARVQQIADQGGPEAAKKASKGRREAKKATKKKAPAKKSKAAAAVEA